ncbi:MAG: type-F conjugative transfer system secretin TraK [Pseudomonadota bacterium]
MRPVFRILLLGSLLLVGAFVEPVAANQQKFTVNEDGLVRFKASITGITRLSVQGDRIASIVNDNDASVYQVKNDENTGDLFLRYVGPEGMPEKEGGYLVTEKGRTIAYEVLPIRASTQTVLITLRGAQPAEVSGGGVTRASTGFAETSLGGGGITSELTEATRKTIARGIRTARPGSAKNGALISTYPMGSLVGEVRVASAGKSARQVREQEFYRNGVLSVWVQDKSLAAGERSWVVVVRNK